MYFIKSRFCKTLKSSILQAIKLSFIYQRHFVLGIIYYNYIIILSLFFSNKSTLKLFKKSLFLYLDNVSIEYHRIGITKSKLPRI